MCKHPFSLIPLRQFPLYDAVVMKMVGNQSSSCWNVEREAKRRHQVAPHAQFCLQANPRPKYWVRLSYLLLHSELQANLLFPPHVAIGLLANRIEIRIGISGLQAYELEFWSLSPWMVNFVDKNLQIRGLQTRNPNTKFDSV